MTSKTNQEMLTEARDSLSPENWRKGSFFKYDSAAGICMCAHGAVQRIANPKVHDALLDFRIGRAHQGAVESATGMAAVEAKNAVQESLRNVDLSVEFAASEAKGVVDEHMAAKTVCGDKLSVVSTDDALKIRKVIGSTNLSITDAMTGYAAVAGNDSMMVLGLRSAWDKRPDWVSKNGVETSWLLGMAGLTTSYNDDSSTTFSNVIARFNRAIEIAQELGI